MSGNLAGRRYLERGKPVEVVTSWGPGGGPRNVAIRRTDGTTVVRPFRGLRKPPDTTGAGPTAPERPPAKATPVATMGPTTASVIAGDDVDNGPSGRKPPAQPDHGGATPAPGALPGETT